MKIFFISMVLGFLFGFIYTKFLKYREIRSKVIDADYFYNQVLKAYDGMFLSRKEYYDLLHSCDEDAETQRIISKDFNRVCIETLDFASKEYDKYIDYLTDEKKEKLLEILNSPRYYLT